MNTEDLRKIEYYRRWLRPDWRRWLHPDCERGLTPEQIKAQRHDFMLRDRAFETPLARRLRREAEEREQIERARLECEHQAEIEREALNLKADLAWTRFELAMVRHLLVLRKAEFAERKRRADAAWERFIAAFKRGEFATHRKANFNPDQPRDELGRWTDSGAADGSDSGDDDPRILSDATPDNFFEPDTQLAQYSFGTLVGQSRVRGGGWICFYKFSFGTIMAPGPTNFRCPSWVTAAGVSHGKLIANDN